MNKINNFYYFIKIRIKWRIIKVKQYIAKNDIFFKIKEAIRHENNKNNTLKIINVKSLTSINKYNERSGNYLLNLIIKII